MTINIALLVLTITGFVMYLFIDPSKPKLVRIGEIVFCCGLLGLVLRGNI